MPFRLLISLGLLCALLPLHHGAPGPDGSAPDPAHYRERVKAMFYHAYDSYLENAFPFDELRPLTCDGHDTWGRWSLLFPRLACNGVIATSAFWLQAILLPQPPSFSLTLIDALDTLLILGNVSEFQRVVEVLQDNVDFDIDVNASVFETNIRVVGGLLSAHLLSKKAGVEVEAGWPCSGPLLRMAEEAARKLLPEYNKAIRNYTRFDDWYLWVQMYKGTVSMPVFQSLEAYWPGLQSLIGDIDNAMRTFLNYYTVWKQFGGLPEFYNIPQGYTVEKREGYPLRPELIESAMYLYRATGDPTLLELGRDAVESIEKISKVECGFATIKDLRDHKLDNRMESFFLAETVKYLYLLFDPTNFIHNNGSTFDTVITPYGECILGAGGYIFNTEAHPIDPAALHCCQRLKEEQWEVEDLMREFYSLKRNRSKFQKKTMSSGPWEPPTRPGILLSPENHDQARERKPAKQKVPLLSCPSQPFTSKLALLGQVFLDSS
ncbi:ER degradation-enhancing alpha-mannosidase-like protein 2 isoform X4 [Rhinopithecus roxellana]|uniref:ER degradation-enhancing alpha-mannosidase-like protein 2 isoform X4 n=1 Tax=Rhinopithecus roxellana TaxID=61622 RepID=UPI00123754E3|nr:ER degradation-enhancing alpha-mannosidase-like protein 2 isoform X4 [Rhinopithecus roxellana]